ncbi:class I lanthipeptide [Chitinophaga solisilvae]|uniref:Uncharacterized protein n=1 Tax=Chitinophaga solisilvae TaxID=1233460 RepID=A0A3S1B2E7_9BACT|nr:class I lanthipeptide [Chitinophaga solisilvae]NSL88334.1 hypothetical protein [Chitinophaga solisilvae]
MKKKKVTLQKLVMQKLVIADLTPQQRAFLKGGAAIPPTRLETCESYISPDICIMCPIITV